MTKKPRQADTSFKISREMEAAGVAAFFHYVARDQPLLAAPEEIVDHILRSMLGAAKGLGS